MGSKRDFPPVTLFCINTVISSATMLAVIPFFLIAATSVVAAPFEKRGMQELVYQCNSGFSYTWDDGPHIHHHDINTAFNEAGGKTTFYLNGNNYGCIYSEDNVNAIRESYLAGHQIAHHTWSHPFLTKKQTMEEVDEEIGRLNDAFVRILGVKPKFFRPPYGDINEQIAQRIQQKWGMTVVIWSDDSKDASGNPSQLYNYNYYTNLAQTSPNAPHLALSHETVDGSVLALQQGTARNLKNAGANLVTTAQCLGVEAYETVTGYFGDRDDSWTCDGPWIPADFSSTTSTSTPTSTSSTSTSTSTSPTSSPTGTCITYTAKAGDTCAKIAAAYGVTVDSIKNANPSWLNCDNIWEWTPVQVCGSSGTTSTSTSTSISTSTSTSTSSASTGNPTGSCFTYTAKNGDTCAKLSATYGVTVDSIKNSNPSWLNCDDIWEWTPVQICGSLGTTTTSSSSTSVPTGSCITYTAKNGDTCAKIGAAYGLSADAIKNANPSWLNCDSIWEWTPVQVCGGSTTTSSSSAPTATATNPICTAYTAKKGDTCAKIAAEYGVTVDAIKSSNPSWLNCDDIWEYTPLCLPRAQ